MKEYKYKINGNDYKVAVGDIEGNVVQVEVNGTPYNVEIEEKEVKKTTVASVKPAAAPRTDTGAKVIAKRCIGRTSSCKITTSWCYQRH